MSSRETVVNRALSGDELKKIILADAERLVNNEGMLSPHIAFGRVSYVLSLKIHVDNPFIPDTLIEAPSRGASKQQVEADPNLAALEKAPLTAPSPDSEVAQLDLTRTITSPNAERLREGMPVPVIVKDHDGTTRTDQITYPPGSFPDLPAGEIMLKDASEALRQQWAPVEQASQTGEEAAKE